MRLPSKKVLVAGIVAASALAVAIDSISDSLTRRANSLYDYSFDVAGVRDPVVHSGGDVSVDPAQEVIGISIEGIDRAYSVRAMSLVPDNHVVNDLIEGIPVTVTYCDLSQCVRVLSAAEPRGRALDVGVAGLRRGKLVLRIEGREYVQDDRQIALKELSFKRTNWKEWKAAHPRSGVYLGQGTSQKLSNPFAISAARRDADYRRFVESSGMLLPKADAGEAANAD